MTGKQEVIGIGEFLTSLNPKLREAVFPTAAANYKESSH